MSRVAAGRGRHWRLLLLLLLSLPLAAGRAEAHATLTASTPAEGAALDAGPGELSLTFDEPVRVLALTLLSEDGGRIPLGAAQASDATLRVPIAAPLPKGRYLVSWRVTSLDGHVVGGSYGFAVGEAAGPPGHAVADAWRWPGFAIHLATRLALLFAVGTALFQMLVARGALPGLERLARRAAWLALLVCLLALGAMGARMAGLAPGQFTLQPLPQAPGLWAWIAGLGGLLLLGCGRGLLRAAGALLAPAFLAAAGHALPIWPGWGEALVWLHGLAAAAWIGALPPLRRALDLPPAEARRLFQRFQGLGLAAVLLVLGSGLALALAILPGWSALWSGAYGLRLSVKLLLVLLMLGIAAANRLWLTRRALAGTRQRRVLALVLGLDLLVAAGVVTLAAGLSLDPPPKARTELVLALAKGDARATLTLRPGRAGDNAAEVTVTDVDGQPWPMQAATLRLAAPEAGIEALEIALEPDGPGRFRAAALPLWAAGAWQLRLELLIDGFNGRRLEGTMTLPP